ncbi:P-loop containing nucleoside triphosphate hydrolase protein [Infundibulicybe gibba]|nr:P-loop containing nucleoside triphosphate hydrolase protein [Infundibulicybe gibba]
MQSVPTLHERREEIRLLPASNIEALANAIFHGDPRLPRNYLAGLNPQDRTFALRAILQLWGVTGGTQVPREVQLKAALATHNGLDSLLNAGTGTGKTLSIPLNSMLDNPKDHWFVLIIGPLKRLQVTQGNDFNTQYQIPTVVINEDTPRNDEWWQTWIYDIKKKTPGIATHIIVTPEQLFRSPEGHLSRFGVLIRNKHFQKLLKRIYVDEVHGIHVDGTDLYGNKAFRPAWGHLGELKALLPRSIPWHCMSATLPPHILKTVETQVLRQNYVSLRVSSNRPNTTYATHQMIKSLDELRNYDCFLMCPYSPEHQPHILALLRQQGSHIGMSDSYLQDAHTSFADPRGTCRILCATAGEATGVDFPNVKIVCTCGLPSSLLVALQRAGRVIRRTGPGNTGLFLVFYEPWVHDISLDDFATGDLRDPDRPQGTLTQSSRKQDRASFASIQYVQSKSCLRDRFAQYLDDQAPDALDFHTEFCCDRHPDSPFDLQQMLPGSIFPGDPPPRPGKRKQPNTKYRPTHERSTLDLRIILWLESRVNANPNCPRTTYDILTHQQRLTLVRTPATLIPSANSIVQLLGESDEWEANYATSLYKVFEDYASDLTKAAAEAKKEEADKKAEERAVVQSKAAEARAEARKKAEEARAAKKKVAEEKKMAKAAAVAARPTKRCRAS